MQISKNKYYRFQMLNKIVTVQALFLKPIQSNSGNSKSLVICYPHIFSNDKSSFITGQSIIVDGGATARLST